ncbi:MAG: caspase family protein [Bacteroidota bacterium]
MFIRLYIFLMLLSASANSQSVNVTGTWKGNAYFMNTQIQNVYELDQHGNTVTGIIFTKQQNDSAKIEVSGTVIGNKLSLLGTRFIYKVGAACLSKVDLTLTQQGDFESLSGKWKGTMSFKTCPPGVSGRVELFKDEPTAVISTPTVIAKSKPTHDIQKNDFEGNELVRALKDRKYYALVIAVEDYQDENIQDLDNPLADAEGLASVLNTSYTFEKSDIRLLRNPNRAEIIEAFDKLAQDIEERDNLFIFYAGHGIWDERLKQGFWLPSDARLDSKAQWLSNSTLRDYISGIKSKHTLLVTDACFSGSIFKERAVFANSRAILEMYKLPSRKAMTSGALKTVPDKSVFIKYLNKNLANNQAPLLSAEQLFQSFKVAVINNSPNGQVPQYGPIGQAGDEGGDFIFLRRE